MKILVNAALKNLLFGAVLLASPLLMAQQAAPKVPYYEAKTFEIGVFPAAAPSKMWVHIDKKTLNRAVRVDLLNARGQVLASEWYARKQPVVRARFDLGNLGDGVYTFSITDGHQTQERTFKLATPGFTEQLPERLITMN